MSSEKFWALFVVVIAVAGGIYTAISGNQPLLGLDLQGGVSVVLQPTTEASDESLDQSIEIIRNRVDSLGVAEPEISRQGETIVVDLPGVKEQQRALELVGRTAELRFRPVLIDLGPALDLAPVDGTTDDTATDDTSDTTAPADDGTSTTAAEETDSTSTTAADTAPTDDSAPADDEGAFGGPIGRFGVSAGSATDSSDDGTTTTAGDDTGSTEADSTGTTEGTDGSDTSTTAAPDGTDAEAEEPVGGEQSTLTPGQLAIIEGCGTGEVTAPEDDLADQIVILTDANGNRICLGPTLLTGEALETADVSLDNFNQWTVNPVFKPGPDGIDAFNDAAGLCFAGSPDPEICPSGRLAIVLDERVVSSPSINSPTFARDQIVISGTFDEEEARDLATVLEFGALPVELETQQTRTVSATIGDDVLRAGVISGLIGLALVAVYLLAYYRLAGLVAIGGLMISALLLWTIVAWFGENLGLALTLAGVVGLIVSIGVSADSNIVYFENVKDAYRGGRKIPTSVERAYRSAISTIVKADVVSLIAAALLYWLTVGAVRGFAFYLGLATILDLVISWLFMKPALAFLARRQAVAENPGLLGLPPSGGDA